MSFVHLIRHGLPDWGRVAKFGWPGSAVDHVPLSDVGMRATLEQSSNFKTLSATLIVSSSMPRASQTAAIIGRALSLPMVVEFDLHEWLPNENFRWETHDDAKLAYADMLKCKGERADSHPLKWERLSRVRERSMGAISKYLSGEKLIIVCHEIVIWALSGHQHTSHLCVRSVDIREDSNPFSIDITESSLSMSRDASK